MSQRKYIRVALLTLAPLLVAAGPVIWGSNAGVRSMFNAPLQWVSRESEARAHFSEFLARFDSLEFVLVSWAGCTVDDERLEAVSDVLMRDQQRRETEGKAKLVDQVLSGYSMVRILMNAPAELSRTEALHRLNGTLVGPDGETSCAVVALTEAGSARRRETITAILDGVKRATGLSRDELRVAGPPIDGLATDDESIRSLQLFSVPAIVISLILCCQCLRSVWLTLPILLVGALGQAATLAAVYFLGITMNAVLIVLPPLVFVLTVSAGVHLVNYYYDELSTGSEDGAVARALRKGLGPCRLAAMTTAIGLASLMVSDVAPVRQFGALAASGILLTFALLILLLPGAMETRHLFSHRWPSKVPSAASRARKAQPDFAQIAGSFVWRYASWISLTCFVLLLTCGAGLLWLRSSINVVSLLAPQNRAVQDFRWFEKHLGALVPVEVVIHFDESCTLDPLQRLELVRSAQGRITEIEELGGAMSAATFFPKIPRPGGFRGTARRAAFRRRVANGEDALVQARYLDVSGSQQSWRISARVLGHEDLDYGQFLDRLRDRVAPLIADYERAGYRGISATCTGVTAVVYEVEKALLADLFDSFLTALALVTIVMVLALKSLRAGLIAMVPNIFPTLVLFGAMGWLERPVDIGTVMTASVALGIAVDGTFHFLKWFCHEMESGQTRCEAITYSYRHCGRALIQTTVICACGLLVFALSGFLPARFFAVNLLLLLVAALVGDLVVLPAILAGPFGRFFVRRRPENASHPHRRPGSKPAHAVC